MSHHHKHSVFFSQPYINTQRIETCVCGANRLATPKLYGSHLIRQPWRNPLNRRFT